MNDSTEKTLNSRATTEDIASDNETPQNNLAEKNDPTANDSSKYISETETETENPSATKPSEAAIDEPNLDITLIHYQQWLTLSIIALIILATFSGFFYFFNDKETRTPVRDVNSLATHFTTMRYPHARQAWLNKAQQNVTELKNDFSVIKEQLNQLQARQDEVELIEQKRTQEEQKNQQPSNAATQNNTIGQPQYQLNPTAHTLLGKTQQNYFSKQALELPNYQSFKTAPFIPAGSFAKAVLLGGVDAPANTLSQTNPEPILLRFVEDGHLPNDTQATLKGCVATAAVVGDISSERGHIRLERLSCIRAAGAIELSVEGSVFGADGKNGVRGQPVWREGKRLQRAAMAGFLSGVTNQLQNLTPTSQDTANTNSKFMLQQGLTQGATSALDKLSEYHIKRAENYHPIIQIDAGKTVDVVFLKGFYLTPQPKETLE